MGAGSILKEAARYSSDRENFRRVYCGEVKPCSYVESLICTEKEPFLRSKLRFATIHLEESEFAWGNK